MLRERTLLRLRLPDGMKIASASEGGQELDVQGDTIDLTPLSGQVSVQARVVKR